MDRYTAVATYTGTVSSSYVKGYTVTAEYKGTVSKTNTDKVLYTAIFEESTPTEKNKANSLYAVLPLGGALAGIAGTILLGKLKKRKGVSALFCPSASGYPLPLPDTEPQDFSLPVPKA